MVPRSTETQSATPLDVPAAQVDDAALREIALSRAEYDVAREGLGRDPTDVELGMIGALWSEHCGYKHSRPLFRHFPTKGPRVLTELGGENAGAVDIGDGWVAVMKIESHNHPSAIEPYEGAATGVGGIVRDIFAMGAQPIALLDSLRFGSLTDARNRRLFTGVVEGIGGYGNCLGIPTVGGEVVFGDGYAGNPLVNAMCLGIAPRDSLISATAEGAGNPLVLVGADTGRDGLHGATFASVELDEDSAGRRPAVQVGNPFMEKLLMDACVELVGEHRDWIVGLQDLGAAGLTSAAVEMAERGGAGVRIDVDRVPRREAGMGAYEVMLSESQERMLVAALPDHLDDVLAHFRHWELQATVVGEVTDDGFARIVEAGRDVGAIEVTMLTDAPAYEPAAAPDPAVAERAAFDPGSLPDVVDPSDTLFRLLAAPNIASKHWIYRQYDHQVGTNTVVVPGADAAVMRIKGTRRALAVCTDGPGRAVALNPRAGAARAVAEAARNVACSGARPVAVTDCLNFANPERPEIYFQLRESILGLADACAAFEAPVVSGNASLYNESDAGPVTPTPVVGMLGVIEDVDRVVRMAFQEAGDRVCLLGAPVAQPAGTLGGSEYLALVHEREAGPVSVDLAAERALVECLLAAAEARLLRSAHDCSDGGIAVAVAESAFAGNLGVELDVDLGERRDAALFGEAGARAVVSVRREDEAALTDLASAHAVPLALLGSVGGDRLLIGRDAVDLPLAHAADAWLHGLERALGEQA